VLAYGEQRLLELAARVAHAQPDVGQQCVAEAARLRGQLGGSAFLYK